MTFLPTENIKVTNRFCQLYRDLFYECFTKIMATTSITIEPTLLSHLWKKNETNFFRLRITLNRKSKYIKTNILVRKEQLGRRSKLKDPDVRYELEKLVKKVEDIARSIDTYALSEMTRIEQFFHIMSRMSR